MPRLSTSSQTRKIRKKKGGHVTRISNYILNNWSPLLCHSNDCVSNACTFLGIEDRTIMHSFAQRYPHGVPISDLIHSLDMHYNTSHYELPFIVLHNQLFRVNTSLSDELLIEPGYATIGLLYSNIATSNHAVVIARSDDNNIILLDPQQCSGIRGLHNIIDYMMSNQFHALTLITQFLYNNSYQIQLPPPKRQRIR